MKLVLTFLLGSATFAAAAQRHQAPPLPNPAVPATAQRPDLKAAGIRAYKQIDFISDGADQLDTARVQTFSLDGDGRVVTWTDLAYASKKDLRTPKPIARGLNPNVFSAKKISYSYDVRGNLISLTEYEGLSGFTDEPFVGAVMSMKQRSLGLKRRRAFTRNYPQHMTEARAFVDSLQKAGPPDAWYALRTRLVTYDADGNPLTIREPAGDRETRYNYEYDAGGRVTRQRSVFTLATAPGDTVEFSGTDAFFQYGPEGRLMQSEVYSAPYDTGDIRQIRYLRDRQDFSYNAAGAPEKVATGAGHNLQTRIYAYANGRLDASTWLMGSRDTISQTRHYYVDTSIVKEDQVVFSDRRPSRYSYRTIGHDARRLRVSNLEISRYVDYPTSVHAALTLYFYGEKVQDARTAAVYRKERDTLPVRIAGARAEEAQNREARSRELAIREAAEMKARRDRPIAGPKDRIARIHEVVLSEPGSPEAGVAVELGGIPYNPGGKQEAAAAPAIFKFVEQMPRFNGDLEAYKAAKLRIPESASQEGVIRKTYVQFVVNTDGSLSGIEIVRSSGSTELDAEAKRFVSRMPPWIPGKQQGKPVRVYNTLVIGFGAP